jgi:hypothetical protein
MSPVFADDLSISFNPSDWPPWLLPAIGAGLGGLIVLIVAGKLLSGGRRKKKAKKVASGLEEVLATLPPPPPGKQRLRVRGVPVRVRLAVLAPLGRGSVIDPDQALMLLDQVLHGLGGAVRADQARVRTWPAQLSGSGFAPTFLRSTARPEPEGRASRWVLACGPARAGNRHIAIGLALLAEQPNHLENLILTEEQWYDALRIEAGPA